MTLDDIIVKIKATEFPQDFKFKKYDKVRILMYGFNGIVINIINTEFPSEGNINTLEMPILYYVLRICDLEDNYKIEVYRQDMLEKIE